jgi:hypothetical protein
MANAVANTLANRLATVHVARLFAMQKSEDDL